MGLLKERQLTPFWRYNSECNDRLSHQVVGTPRATTAQKELDNC